MAHIKKPTTPVGAGNRPAEGPLVEGYPSQPAHGDTRSGAPFQDQDPKRRLGDYGGAGEHAFQQPGGKNDSDREAR
jgi:hypothetical protein